MFLRELYEEDGKTAVLAFGRLNPPTIGHAKLVDAITSQPGDHYLFLSQTQKPKTDPLDFATKVKFVKQFFPNINIGDEGARTPVQALEKLQSLGYTDIIFVAGSDRVEGFQKLFDTYNGLADKSGNVPFKFNSIKVVSAGERDPDADGAEGMSASKMRAAAASGDLQSFAQGVPDKKLAQTMYDAVRRGMGVKDAVPAEGVAEGSYTTEKQILTRIRQIMYDRKLSGTESNAGELHRLKQQLKDIRSQQGVAEGKWDPFTGGDYGQTPRPQRVGQDSQDSDTDEPNKEKDQAEWEAMLDYYGTNALVQRALGDLYQQTHGTGYHDNISGPIRYVATIVSGLGKQRTEVYNVKSKQEAHEKARGMINGRVVSIEKVDTKEDESDLITLPVMLGLGAQRKKWMLKFPDERYAQKWEFKHKNVAQIIWPGDHELSKPEEKVGEGMANAVDAKGRTQQQWIKLVKTKFPTARIAQAKMMGGPIIAYLDDGRKLSWKKAEQGVAEGAEDLTPNMAKYVLDQIYNSNGAVTMTDLFDEGIPGLRDMFMATAQELGLDPDEDFQDVESEVLEKLEGIVKGGHGLDEAQGNDFRVGQRVMFKSSNGQEIPAIVTAVDFDEDAVKIKSADNKPLPNAGGDFETIVDPGWKFLTPEPRVDPNSIIAVSPNMRKTTERVRDPEDWDEGNTEPPNNFAVYINGKKWKVFQGRGQYADDQREKAHYQQLKAWAQQKSAQSGKKWEVHTTGEAPTA